MGAFFVGHCGWSTRLVRWEKDAGHYNLKLSLIPGCGNKVPRCCGIVFSWSNARLPQGAGCNELWIGTSLWERRFRRDAVASFFSRSNARSHRGQIVAIFGPAPLLCELACRR